MLVLATKVPITLWLMMHIAVGAEFAPPFLCASGELGSCGSQGGHADQGRDGSAEGAPALGDRRARHPRVPAARLRHGRGRGVQGAGAAALGWQHA